MGIQEIDVLAIKRAAGSPKPTRELGDTGIGSNPTVQRSSAIKRGDVMIDTQDYESVTPLRLVEQTQLTQITTVMSQD
jgi:hypothetical protein